MGLLVHFDGTLKGVKSEKEVMDEEKREWSSAEVESEALGGPEEA